MVTARPGWWKSCGAASPGANCLGDWTMRILITGGAGYVGAQLVPNLLEKGLQVTVLDLMIYGEEVLPQHENLTLEKGDIRDQALLSQIIQDEYLNE